MEKNRLTVKSGKRIRKKENGMQDTSQTIDDVMENTKNRLTDSARKAQDTGAQVWEDTLALVKRHPGQSLGIALAAGATLGVLASSLMSRRESPSVYSGLRKAMHTGQDSWQNFRTAFDKGIEGLRDAVDEVKSSFR
jgi:ElaB/YqjD/DUF883 family membrane-anchored ribosome-binding protein